MGKILLWQNITSLNIFSLSALGVKKNRVFKLAHYNYLEIIVCCSYKTQSNDSFYYKSAFNISYYCPLALKKL